MKKKFLLIFLLTFNIQELCLAETDDADDDIKVIEVELLSNKALSEPLQEPTPEIEEVLPEKYEFKDLGTLSHFKEVSVIQKRFMPKTGRFQFFGGATVVTNDPFFMTTGLVGKVGYFFNETWGAEMNYFALNNTEKQSTQELKSIQGVKTQSLVYPSTFYAFDLTYVPIYGKISLFNQKIIPFDLYFSAGYGATKVQTNENAGTMHLATGQIFSLSKQTAFRWDFSWNFYSTTGIDGQVSAFNNLFLTVGMSLFLPEAGYR